MMSSDWLVGRRGQVLAVGITVLVAALLWAGAVNPLLAWHAEQTETLRQQSVLAERMASTAALLPALRRQLEAGAAGNRASTAVMLAGATDAIAGANLQEQVQSMASAAGASLASIETLPAEQADAWRRVGLRVSVTAPWPVLIHLLESVNQATPPMLIDDLRVHASPATSRPAGLPLQTSFTIYAFRAAASTRDARP
jgi:general secretion pathway protein M